MKQYNSIDVGKLVMSIVVVAMHTYNFEYCHNHVIQAVIHCVMQMAVPFFFISSGFLIAQKLNGPFYDNANIQIIKTYMIHMIRLYLIWTILYMPLTVYHCLSEGISLREMAANFAVGFVLTGEQYNSWHLWFVLASIYAAVFILIAMRLKVSIEKVIMVGCVIFIICAVMGGLESHYREGLPIVLALFYKACKFSKIMKGMFFMPVGILLAKKKIPTPIAWPIFLIGVALSAFVATGALKILVDGLTSIALFNAVESIVLPDSGAFFVLRKMSTVIFFIHMYVWSIYYMLVYGTKTTGVDSFLCTTLISIVFSLVYVKVRYFRNAAFSQ